MNMHQPQNILAETELRHLAAIPYQIISPSSNSPIIGMYQDSLLGAYEFTRGEIEFDPRTAMNLLMSYPKVDTSIFKDRKNITNFEILSQIMPPISLKYKTSGYNENEDEALTKTGILEIKNGKYIRGQADKNVFGSGSKGILHRVYNDYGHTAAYEFIDNIQQVITDYMKTHAFSVGVSDLICDKKTNESILQVIAAKKNEVQEITNKIHMGVFENNTGKSNMAEYENQVGNILNDAINVAGKLATKSLGKTNRFVTMVSSGSKGSPLNMSQMLSCLGQTSVDGKRVPYGFDNRTLPHYSKYDDSPSARGFIESSYISGLSAPELFFHAMGGRIGLIDTAIKTSSTGYIQRRLIKGLEDLKVEYDMTVRNNMGRITQFAYGDDSIDTTKVENQSMRLVTMSIEDVYMHYDIPGLYESSKDDRQNIMKVFTKGASTRIQKQKEETRKMCKKYVDFMLTMRDNIVKQVFKGKNDTDVRVPVAFQYLIQNIQGQLDLNSQSAVDITPLECMELVEEKFQDLSKLYYTSPSKLFEVLYYFYLSPKDLLLNKRFNKKAILLLLDNIEIHYRKAIVHPGEMVGVIAGQSIGEPTTQMTLNSFTYETEILVKDHNGKIAIKQIGEFVNHYIEMATKREYYSEKDTTYAELNEYWEVPSVDENGNVMWKKIEAVTKHPVINEDGTNTMLKVTTREQREVVATKAKSFLKLVDGQIQPLRGDELSVGDYLPVNKKPIDFVESIKLNLKTILPPQKYIYGSEFEKASSVSTEHHWWSKHHTKLFTLPYSRSDALLDRININNERINNVEKSSNVIQSGYVYMKNTGNIVGLIPEYIDLDYDFGYLLGAYCAEGCMTKTQISISNNEVSYFEPIIRLCNKWNITTKIYKTENKTQEGWTSQDIRIYNVLLCRIVEQLCGKLSHCKYIDDKIVFSNSICIHGFIDGYYGGDGHIDKKAHGIMFTSVSVKLLLGVQQMLNVLDIYSYVRKPTIITHNNRGSQDIKQHYNLIVPNGQAKKLANQMNINIEYKKEWLNHHIIEYAKGRQYEYGKRYNFVPNSINGKIVLEERRMPDVFFDEVISIEEVPNTTEYAYDLTVADTKNFNLYNGLCVRDTFHSAGVASKSNVTRGVPRIEEILRLTKNPKNPSMTIALKQEDQQNKDKAVNFCNMIQHTTLIDLVKSVQICYDPDDNNTRIHDDKALIDQFYEFEKMVAECNHPSANEASAAEQANRSKWIIRIEMNADALLDKNISMDDIHFAITQTYGNEVYCVFSDFNSSNLVFRVRMNTSAFRKSKRGNALDQSDDIFILKNFQDSLLNNIVIRGITGVSNVMPRPIKNSVVKEDGKFVRKDTWVLDTVGTNMIDLMTVDFIDYFNTFTNDIREIYDVLGIEAARQSILNEFNEVMEFSGGYVNYHHLSVLCDRMTVSKKLVPIFRSGIMNDDTGPIAKATFEMHTEAFLDASRHGEFDQMRGVSANVMCGQPGYYGTNAFQVVLDMKAFENMDDAKTNVDDVDKLIEDGFKNLRIDETDECSKGKIMIDNNIRNLATKEMGVCLDDGYNLL